MKSILLAITALLLSFTALAAAPPGLSEQIELHGKQFVRVEEKWFVESTPEQWFEVVPDVVTVKFKRTVARAEKSNFFRSNNIAQIRANRLGAEDIRVPPGQDPVTFVTRLSKSKLFEYVEVNTYGRYNLTPDDTRFTDQWGLDNTGQTGGTVDADVDAPEAWDIGVALPDVAVAVLDSGTDYDHEDLECNIWVNPGEDVDNDGVVMDADDFNGIDDDGNGFIDDLIGWDFDGSDNDPDPTNDHGTHVAGIIGACGDNAMGVIGVAGGIGPGTGAKMIPLLVGNAAPDGSILDDAIIYAADNGARVIAMSLSVGESQAIKDALTYAYDTMGVFIVNASGNDNSSVGFPATDAHVVAVGATDHDDIRADFATWGSNFGPELEVVAPGVSILSTVLADAYAYKGGTSMASPHVSGTAALMFSLYPAATNQEVRDCITGTAEDEVGDPAEDTPGRDEYYGFGRLNAADALACIIPNNPPVAENDTYSTAEDTPLNEPASGVLTNDSDVDGDPLIAVLDTSTVNGSLSLNANGSFDYTPNLNYCGPDSFTYHANDGIANSNIATVNITVVCVNDPPVAINNHYTHDEDTLLVGNVITDETGEGVDNDVDGDGLSMFSNTGAAHGVVVFNPDKSGAFTYDPNLNYCGPDSFTYVITDDPPANPPPLTSNTATVSISVACVNDPPEVISVAPGSQSADYSDKIGTVTIIVEDVDDISTTLVESNEPPGSVVSLASASTGCTTVVTESPAEDGSICTFDYDGQVLDPGDNLYEILFTPRDEGPGTVTGTHALTITPEQATATLDGGNPVAEEVEEAGGNAVFELYFSAIETLPDLAGIGDPEHGDLNKMEGFMELVPVGPGGPESGVCSLISPLPNPADAYAQVAIFECLFDEVPVNTYEVFAWVDGASEITRYYVSAKDDGVLVVFDPSLGFTTGGGWFYWPGTEDPELQACGEEGYPGDKASFGYTMKYNKKMTNVQGSLLLQRNTVDENCEGAGKYRVKSNALDGLAIGDDTDDMGDYGWAAFSGKSVFNEPDAEAEGNHAFLIYVEDHGDQGGAQTPADEFWIQVKDKDEIVVLEVNGPDSDPTGEDGTDGDDTPIENGNIIVPHNPQGKGKVKP